MITYCCWASKPEVSQYKGTVDYEVLFLLIFYLATRVHGIIERCVLTGGPDWS